MQLLEIPYFEAQQRDFHVVNLDSSALDQAALKAGSKPCIASDTLPEPRALEMREQQ